MDTFHFHPLIEDVPRLGTVYTIPQRTEMVPNAGYGGGQVKSLFS
jgi:hypothetical protein